MRIVIDTGVIVSALLLPRSVPRQAFDAAASHGTLLASKATIAELDEVLRRPKFDKYIPEPMRLEFFAALVLMAEEVEIKDAIDACRDPKDDKFLELAVSGGASHIISGDQDLLQLHAFRGVAILTPKAFLATIPGVSL